MLPIPFDHSLYLINQLSFSNRQFCLPKFAHVDTGGLQEVTTGSRPFKSWRTGPEQHVDFRVLQSFAVPDENC